MKPSLSLFWMYIKNLFQRWILWIFLAFDFIAFIVQVFIPSLRLPQFVYILIAVIGLIWAGFESYLDLLKQIPSESRPLEPEIYIFFEEGNEYSYEFKSSKDRILESKENNDQKSQEEVDSNQIEFTSIPVSLLIQHIRLENKGLVTVKILSVAGHFKYNDNLLDFGFAEPYKYYSPDILDSNSIEVSYPIILKSKDTILFHAVSKISPNTLLTDAQISARSNSILEKKETVESSISVEVIDPNKKTYNYQAIQKISLTPLCNMYISHWKKLGRTDLVKLAMGDTSID